MALQVPITEAVIDMVLAVPQNVRMPMPTHDQIRDELIRQIDSGEIKQIDVARKLAVAPARIAEVRKGQRKIQPDELHIVAALLGMVTPEASTTQVLSTQMIPNYGRVAQGVWLEQLPEDIAAEREPVPYDRMPGDPPAIDLFAVTPEGKSMDRIFPPGIRLICQRVPWGVGKVRQGSLVIVSRISHDLHELTCKRLRRDDDGYWLESESTSTDFAEPWFIGDGESDGAGQDIEIRIIGTVIRGVIDYQGGAYGTA